MYEIVKFSHLKGRWVVVEEFGFIIGVQKLHKGFQLGETYHTVARDEIASSSYSSKPLTGVLGAPIVIGSF